MNKQQIEKIYKKLKIFHPLWSNGDNAYKERIEKSLDKDFEKLEELGVPRHFSEALLFFGASFANSTANELKANEIAKKKNITSFQIIEKDGKVGIKPA